MGFASSRSMLGAARMPRCVVAFPPGRLELALFVICASTHVWSEPPEANSHFMIAKEVTGFHTGDA
jgi:hypothetical protein